MPPLLPVFTATIIAFWRWLMCGRFVLVSSWEKIAGEFDLSETDNDPSAAGDIHPGQDSICIIRDGAINKAVNLHWGLVPSWLAQKPGSKLLINARAETLAEKPTFRDAFQKRRCLIIADGFYEWTKEKKPFYFYLKNGRPLGLAGLYEPATVAGSPKLSFVILTTSPNKLIAPLHDRMPVIIPAGKRSYWLDQSLYDKARLQSLLVSYPEAQMAMRKAEITSRYLFNT
jgi:putative SOS response-associated peptidase YedK